MAVCGTMMAQPAAHAKKASRSQNVATWRAQAPIFRAQATTPAQWETLIDENFDNLTGGNNATPAIILAKENEWIEIDGGGSRITNLTFWYRGVTAPDDDNERFMAVSIEGWDGHQWKHINDVQDYPTADSEGEIFDFGAYIDEYNEYSEEEGYDPISFRGMYTKIRIQPESMNYGVRVAIDDITISAEPATTVETLVENQAVNANDYLFTNVDMTAKGVRYFVGVNAVNGKTTKIVVK